MNKLPQIIIKDSGGVFSIGDAGSFIDFIPIVISLLALGFSVWSFFLERKRKRQEATIYAFDKLQDELYKKEDCCIWNFVYEKNEEIDKKYNEYCNDILDQIRLVEHFAVGINSGTYDIETLSNMACERTIKVWEALEDIIEDRRNENGIYKKKYYEAFEIMVNDLRKLDKSNKKSLFKRIFNK